MTQHPVLAAIDLGSNSFRLEIAHINHGQVLRTEYLKETVRLGNGITAQGMLTEESMQRGWDCLARFAERIKGFSPNSVCAVATQTLREAQNREVFLLKAQTILGFDITVISGEQEARLIYSGVSHLLPQSDDRRLVIDIGGRSTELVLGAALDTHKMISLRLGSVNWSMKYFAENVFTKAHFNAANIAAKALLDEHMPTFNVQHWDIAYGASGTIGAIADILIAQGQPNRDIQLHDIDALIEAMCHARRIDKLKILGLKEDRKAVIAGGLSILKALFETLQITVLHPADGALRHGVLFELQERDSTQQDVRQQTVTALMQRFQVDGTQADRVSTLSHVFMQQLAQSEINHIPHLECAAQLHEIGKIIAFKDYHRHGAYIIENSLINGFSVASVKFIAALILGQKGKLKKVELFLDDQEFAFALLSLRLAIHLCHARIEPDLQGIVLTQTSNNALQFQITVDSGWAQQYPQSLYLIQQEIQYWSKTKFSVKLHI